MKINRLAPMMIGLAMLASSVPVSAGDSNGNFQAKLGVTGVLTDDKTTSLALISPAGASTNLLTGNAAETTDTVIPSLTLTYFFNRNIAAELFCCFDKIGVKGDKGLKGLGEIAETWVFPPIVTLQYHFTGMGAFKPYIGAGVQWVHYFNSKVGDNGLTALGVTPVSVDFKDSFGLALQAGVDFDLGAGWSLGLDVKKVFEDTKITWTNSNGSRVVANHDIDPLFVTANLGYRFNLDDLFGRRSAAPLK